MIDIIAIISLIAFIIIFYNIYRIKKEQKKTVFLLGKIYEHSGGKLLQYEKDFLEE